jgi:hypothetical protein
MSKDDWVLEYLYSFLSNMGRHFCGIVTSTFAYRVKDYVTCQQNMTDLLELNRKMKCYIKYTEAQMNQSVILYYLCYLNISPTT